MNEKNKSIDDIIRNSDIAGFLSGIMGRNMGNVESNNSGLDSVLDSLVAMKSRGEDVESSGVDTTDKQQQLLKILLNSQPQPPNRSTYGGRKLKNVHEVHCSIFWYFLYMFCHTGFTESYVLPHRIYRIICLAEESGPTFQKNDQI